MKKKLLPVLILGSFIVLIALVNKNNTTNNTDKAAYYNIIEASAPSRETSEDLKLKDMLIPELNNKRPSIGEVKYPPKPFDKTKSKIRELHILESKKYDDKIAVMFCFLDAKNDFNEGYAIVETSTPSVISISFNKIDMNSNYTRNGLSGNSFDKPANSIFMLGGFINNKNIKSIHINFQGTLVDLPISKDGYYCYFGDGSTVTYSSFEALDENKNVIPMFKN